jgi:hypothetical protein
MPFSLPGHIDPRHCIVTKQYALYTPPMHEMIGQIGEWIDQQCPGGYIYGASRLGKSRCVQWYVANELQERFKAVVPLVVWNRRPDSQTSEAGFWHQLLLASRFEFANPAKPPKKAEAIHLCKQRFIAIANNAQLNYIVLLIDEAQDLTFREWKWLVGLQNELDYDGYLLSVFSVDSHQLNYRHEFGHHGQRSCRRALYGSACALPRPALARGDRVRAQWIRYRLRMAARQRHSVSGVLCPVDYAAGRRLAGCAAQLWKALMELSPESARRPNQRQVFRRKPLLRRSDAKMRL